MRWARQTSADKPNRSLAKTSFVLQTVSCVGFSALRAQGLKQKASQSPG
jgi:hypothetical protein